MELIINRKDCQQLAEHVCCGAPDKVVVNLDGTKDCIEVVSLMQSDEYDFDDESVEIEDLRTDWERDMFVEERRLREIVESWKDSCVLDSPETWNSFRWMEDFVNEIVDERDAFAIKQLSKAIGGRGTFSRFLNAARRTGYIEKWYEYRDRHQTQYVADALEDCGFKVVETGGKPMTPLNKSGLFSFVE